MAVMPGEHNGMMFDDQIKALVIEEAQEEKKEKEKTVNLELLDSMIAMLAALRRGM